MIENDVVITVTLSGGTAYTITIPTLLAMDLPRGTLITNTAYFERGDVSGNSSISFSIALLNQINLPLLWSN